ncbi:HPP family protein [Roseibium sp.]|uniref:HPP family protein n=1 Tax=Roseibium sp. TaxID=1936156 RepID=UPI003A97E90E
MSIFQRLNPSLVPTSGLERLRASLGALTGILLTGLVSTLSLGSDVNLPLLIAPMGASAVLLFAVPNSPLAQPWSILGGNLIAAFVGVTLALVIHEPLLAASAAIAVSIGIMLMLNCLHPPSGAVALTAVLGGPAIHDAGYWFLLSPVGVNSILILAVALVFNNITGRHYPHGASTSANAHKTADAPPSRRVGVTGADIRAVIAEQDELLDVSPEDLDELLHRAQIRAFNRQAGQMTCAHIMSTNLRTVRPETKLTEAWRRLVSHHVKGLPVVDAEGKLTGIITRANFIDHSVLSPEGRLKFGPAQVLVATVKRTPPMRLVQDIMTRRVQSALPDTPVGLLVSPMADQGVHHMPIVDADNHLVGIVTQSDLLAALFRRPPQEVSSLHTPDPTVRGLTLQEQF